MPNNDVGTNPFYVSTISLLPTIDFLEYVAKKQWDSDVSYGLGISTIVPMFHSTTNSEWLCLNSESEFLESPKGTISIKNPFAYTRPESSPVYIGYNDISIPSAKANKAKSLYLFRIDEDGKNEVIMVSNYDKKPDNVTSAPPIDCFSRECLTWFSSNIDWFTGFGISSQSLAPFIVDDDGIILSKSSDILAGIIPESVTTVDYTNIQVLNTVSTLTPWVSIQLSTGIQFLNSASDDINLLFLYSVDENNDSMVAFCHGYTTPFSQGISYDTIITDISFNSKDIIII
jgi:hypothetical protein